MMETEQWKRIEGMPMFEASTLGRVRRIAWSEKAYGRSQNIKRGRPFYLTPQVQKSIRHDYRVGYLIYKLCDQAVLPPIQKSAARLILETFYGKRGREFVPGFKNGDARDIRLCNLIWTNRKKHEVKSGFFLVHSDSAQSPREVYCESIKD